MGKYTERCPSCGKDNGHLMGSGTNFTLYYSCFSCGHDFIVDGSKYINEKKRVKKYATQK